MTAMMLAFMHSSAHAAEDVEITQARIESSDDGYRLAAGFAFDLNPGLQGAIERGVSLYFTTEVEISRPRWYWFDEKTISASQTVRLSYNVLTRQYHVAVIGRLQQSFQTLDDALALLRRPNRWVVAEKDALKPGQTYQAAVRMALDVAQLAKPFQINALHKSEWQLSSDWHRFSFQADPK